MGLIHQQINLELSERAKHAVTELIESSSLVSPIPGLLWVKANDELEYNWAIGLYEEKEIQEGWFFEVSGSKFYTYQDWFLEEIDGGIIDIVENRLTINKKDTNLPIRFKGDGREFHAQIMRKKEQE